MLIAILKFLRHIGDKVLCDDENVKIFKEGHTFVQDPSVEDLVILKVNYLIKCIRIIFLFNFYLYSFYLQNSK